MSGAEERDSKTVAAAEAPPAVDAADAERVGRALATLGKSVRAHQIYQAANPVYDRFVEELRQEFAGLWSLMPVLELRVDEQAFVWESHEFQVGEGRSSLSFLFFKDGIRYLTFLPGFEEESPRLLDVLDRARAPDQQGDDLITLLWHEDFQFLQIGYIDQLAESLELPERGAGLTQPLSLADIRLELAEAEPAEAEGAEAEGVEAETAQDGAPAESPSGLVSMDDFQETLFFLDKRELDQLERELSREWNRDLKREVLNALLDRLGDDIPDQQLQVVEVLEQLVPILLGQGGLAMAAELVVEVQTARKQGRLTAESVECADRLMTELSEPAVLEQLLRLMNEGVVDPGAEELSVFLDRLQPQALPVLVRAVEMTPHLGLKHRLASAMEGLARGNAELVGELLDAADPLVARGAAHLAGRIQLGELVPRLADLLDSGDDALRLAAVDALVAVHSAEAVNALLAALSSDDRAVRLAAVRGVASLGYAPARKRMEEILQGRELREADLTEKIAFFEAYSAIAGGEGVSLLDSLLNGRGLLGPKNPPEIRACAARALGVIGTPAATKALKGARSDKDPLVRNAVVQAGRAVGSP